MESEKKQRGGARLGAGRKKMANGRNIRVGLTLSQRAFDVLERMAQESGTTKNDVINRMLEAIANSQCTAADTSAS